LRLIRKFEAEEKKLYTDNVLDVAIEYNIKSNVVPPRPFLMARTDGFMLLKPAKFKSAKKQRVQLILVINFMKCCCRYSWLGYSGSA